jgi:hypothetical protein
MASVTSPIESTLRVLLERLNWPVRMVRVVTAREYAKLLSSPVLGKKAVRVFLRWLSTRELESQIATGLAVLLCTVDEDLPPFQDVCEAIRQPSIIADMLLQHIYGVGNRKGGWRIAHSGLAPDDFAPSKYFEDHKTAHVPLVFSSQIDRLESKFWFPFARQWAFEWQRLMDRGGIPYSDFPYHFVGNLARSGIVGQFELAQSDVMRSAYLRMLACAFSEGAMTAPQTGFYAMDCLPINRGLFRIKPVDRPVWLSEIPEECCAAGASLKAGARKLIAASINSPGMRLVSLLTPIKANLFEFGDLTISAVMATDDFVPPDMKESYFSLGVPWLLPDTITFEGGLDEEDTERVTVEGKTGRCTPVCLDVFPMPFGYWLADYLVAGYALPAPYLFANPPKVTCDEGGIWMRTDGSIVAKLSVWHDRWTPLYAKDGGHTRCGILTEMSTSALEQALERHGLSLGWVAQLRLWSRKTDHGEYELTTRREFFLD